MIPSSQETPPPLSGFSGFYRGRVEAVDDPLKMGRARVRVMPMFEQVRIDDLPWAHPAWPVGPSGSDQGYFSAPSVGSVVWCFFEASDIMQPVYWAVSAAAKNGGQLPLTPEESRKISGQAYQAKTSARVQNVQTAAGSTWSEPAPGNPANSTYPLNRVLKTASGHVIEIDDTPNSRRLHVYHPAGSWVEILEDGTTTVHSKGDLVQVALKDEKISVSQNFNVTANSIGMKAPTVTINADNIRLGSSSSSQGVPLQTALLSWLNTHTHIGNLGAPTSPALTPADPSLFSTKVKVE